jgi:hypothetical protein
MCFEEWENTAACQTSLKSIQCIETTNQQENDMSNTPMIAFQMTQTIGKAQVERERAEEIARLYGQLESALRSGAKAYIVDGLEQAIHNWRTKEFHAPYLYGGIRSDFANFLGTELEKAHPIFDDIVDAMMNPAPTIWADYIKETEDAKRRETTRLLHQLLQRRIKV